MIDRSAMYHAQIGYKIGAFQLNYNLGFSPYGTKGEMNENARARLLFLVLDEPPGMEDNMINILQSTVKKMAGKGIRVIPVVSRGTGYSADKSQEYLMRSYALGTNGTYIFLTDHSGIGDAHTQPTTDEYDVEYLNDILIRLTDQYTFAPTCQYNKDSVSAKDTVFVYSPFIIDHVSLDSALISGTDSIHPVVIAHESEVEVVPVTAQKDSVENQDSIVDTYVDEQVSEVADTQQTEKTLLFKIYPNPTDGNLVVELEENLGEIYVSDISSKLLQKHLVEDRKILNIDISTYPSGIYFIRYYNAGHDKWISGKVVLQR